MLGPARTATYLAAASDDVARARALYLWATEIAGALHAQISFVEIAVRNAVDVQLAPWNAAQGFTAEWTAEANAGDALYRVVRKPLATARLNADREAGRRAAGHPRAQAGVSHDDVVAQLMFGAWVQMIRPISSTESHALQQKLWREALHQAFPNADSSDAGRLKVGQQLERVRRLRNRVAHHDSLLCENPAKQLGNMLSILAAIDRTFPTLAMERSTVRRLAKEDPRRGW